MQRFGRKMKNFNLDLSWKSSRIYGENETSYD